MNIIATLEEQRDELRKELRAVENVLNQLKSEIKRVDNSSTPTLPIITNNKKTMPNRGAAAQIFRYIYTGNTKSSSIAEVSNLPLHTVEHAMTMLQAEGKIKVCDNNGNFKLTEKWLLIAKYFVANPLAKSLPKDFGK